MKTLNKRTSFTLLIIAGLFLSGCDTSLRPTLQKPDAVGQAIEASPALKQFLISHGFHTEDGHFYKRQYRSLREASGDLGISLVNLPIPPNGPMPGPNFKDERVFTLYNWDFVVLAEKGRMLDNPNTPCKVSTSLIQVR